MTPIYYKTMLKLATYTLIFFTISSTYAKIVISEVTKNHIVFEVRDEKISRSFNHGDILHIYKEKVYTQGSNQYYGLVDSVTVANKFRNTIHANYLWDGAHSYMKKGYFVVASNKSLITNQSDLEMVTKVTSTEIKPNSFLYMVSFSVLQLAKTTHKKNEPFGFTPQLAVSGLYVFNHNFMTGVKYQVFNDSLGNFGYIKGKVYHELLFDYSILIYKKYPTILRFGAGVNFQKTIYEKETIDGVYETSISILSPGSMHHTLSLNYSLRNISSPYSPRLDQRISLEYGIAFIYE